MLVLYIGLLWFTVKTAGRSVASEHSAKPAKALWLTLVFIVVGLAGLVGGGELFLHHATVIARKLGVSESVIAITLVAGGTSLPELASSVVSVVKGKAGLALGNVLGSNIANILLILGVSATIRPLTMGGITTLDVSMVVLSSLLLFLTAFTFRRKTVDRWEGAIFLATYAPSRTPRPALRPPGSVAASRSGVSWRESSGAKAGGAASPRCVSDAMRRLRVPQNGAGPSAP